MAFSDFRYPAVIQELGLTEVTAENLYPAARPVVPVLANPAVLEVGTRLALNINTEKAKSEWLIAPILGDLWSRYRGRMNLHSGVEFDADPDARLTGRCDFLIGRGPQFPYLTAPVLMVVEAKNDNVYEGFGQAIAGMVGMQRFNRREGHPLDPVFGCSTTGTAWRFVQLSGTVVTIDLTEYHLGQVDRILGIFTHIVGPVPEPAAA